MSSRAPFFFFVTQPPFFPVAHHECAVKTKISVGTSRKPFPIYHIIAFKGGDVGRDYRNMYKVAGGSESVL